MPACTAKSHKYQKLDWENKQKERFLKKQREEKDFWDEYKEPLLESSYDESNVKSNLNKSSFEKGDLGLDNVQGDNVRKDNVWGDNTFEGLEDNGWVQSEVKENSFRPVWKNDKRGFL